MAVVPARSVSNTRGNYDDHYHRHHHHHHCL